MQRVNKRRNMLQKHVYTAGGERIEQFTDRTAQSGGNGGLVRMLYVHEDIVGNTMYYTKDTGSSFCELRYDVWGFPDLSGKLQNNDNGNFVAANFTGHTYDTVLDIYFAEARFYDAANRQWMASDPIKSGLNWYAYCAANPTTYFDPTGLFYITINEGPYGDFDDMQILEIHDENVVKVGFDGALNSISFGISNWLNNKIKEDKGAFIGNTYENPNLGEVLADAGVEWVIDEVATKVIEEFADKFAGKLFGAITTAIDIGSSTDVVFNDDLIFDAMDQAGFTYDQIFNERPEAEQEAIRIYQTYVDTSEYLYQMSDYFYFKPFGCMPSYNDAYEKVNEYGVDSDKSNKYLNKLQKQFKDKLFWQMQGNDSYYNYKTYGTNDLTELNDIAGLWSNTYRHDLNNLQEMHNIIIEGLKEILQKI